MLERKFDWEEAAKLRASGVAVKEIAQMMGVSRSAIYLHTTHGSYARALCASAHHQRIGAATCIDCGGPRSRNDCQGLKRCLKCFHKKLTTSVREDSLQCMKCREWKHDNDFSWSSSRPHRRHRHTECRKCSTLSKREYRARKRGIQ